MRGKDIVPQMMLVCMYMYVSMSYEWGHSKYKTRR
jgi:hypothetical protein